MIALRVFAFLILMVPLAVYAQTFKCRNSEGKVVYLDSPCPAGTSLESTIQSSNSDSSARLETARRHMPSYMPDESCMQETQSAAKNCVEPSNNLTKQCMRERLSAGCLRQYESGPGAIRTADEKCQQEIRAAATPCAQGQMASGRQCVQEKLSARCRDQMERFKTENEKAVKKCSDVMMQVKQLCPASGEAFVKCMQGHQSEIKAACNP